MPSHKKTIIFAATLILAACAAGAGTNPALEARNILEKTIQREYEDITMQVHLVKVSRSGRERSMDLSVKIKKTEDATKTLAVFTDPIEVRGISSLSWDYDGLDKPSDRWFKLAGLDYVKCLGKACRRMEERFGFSMDVFAIRLEEADHELLGEEEVDGSACYKIESRAKNPDDERGARFVTWVDKKMYAARRIEVYDSTGRLMQRSTFTEFKKLGDHWWETKGRLEKLDSGKEVRFEIKKAEINTGIPDDEFEKPPVFKVEDE